jgi:hypothetical protein
MVHDREIVGSNPGTVYWMDVSDASYYIKEKLKNKGSQMGHTKKKFKKGMKKCFVTLPSASIRSHSLHIIKDNVRRLNS